MVFFRSRTVEHLFHATSVATVKLGSVSAIAQLVANVTSRILADQVSPLGAAGTTKILHLHNLRQLRAVDLIVQSLLSEVPLEQFLLLVLQVNKTLVSSF